MVKVKVVRPYVVTVLFDYVDNKNNLAEKDAIVVMNAYEPDALIEIVSIDKNTQRNESTVTVSVKDKV